jgi:hypothetical protein
MVHKVDKEVMVHITLSGGFDQAPGKWNKRIREQGSRSKKINHEQHEQKTIKKNMTIVIFIQPKPHLRAV